MTSVSRSGRWRRIEPPPVEDHPFVDDVGGELRRGLEARFIAPPLSISTRLVDFEVGDVGVVGQVARGEAKTVSQGRRRDHQIKGAVAWSSAR